MKKNQNFRLIALPLCSAVLLLSACATTQTTPEPSTERARSELTRLQSDPRLSTAAPLALKDAEQAVTRAEQAQGQPEAAHYGYMAEQQVAIADEQAKRRLSEQELKTLADERDRVRLEARTLEADRAKASATTARQQADAARTEALTAQQKAEAARNEALTAQQQAEKARQAALLQQQAAASAAADAERARLENEELRQQMSELNAQMTDRGLVLTLGDVLFATGKSDLKPVMASKLGKLVTFLNKYPDRTVVIEGHTDSVGSDAYNLNLSQQRADSVRGYLASQGVATTRIATAGKGKSSPIASNDNAAGRQQNRRVEIIIQNPPKK